MCGRDLKKFSGVKTWSPIRKNRELNEVIKGGIMRKRSNEKCGREGETERRVKMIGRNSITEVTSRSKFLIRYWSEANGE
jgi:hypothetical protein